MLKITVTIKEDKEKDNCNIKLECQKDVSKCTKQEKITGKCVFDTIASSLQNLNEEK